ncbi:hypothetical protein Afil01_25460 [Actinorhabdospora filicis]|uniref:Tetratricopeptide repeat protein n=1 Tax=Actinorhabdospora filicis TaxID=1785913 RepID=A0A9W6SL70_9ACTN|nr:hypothetical protein [Actinorhabdospora filicis]GLZ77739.1 hypothetical protein Afil01_25460 [Actinorhabdospora filicis]
MTDTPTRLALAGRLLGDCAVLLAEGLVPGEVVPMLDEARAHYDAVGEDAGHAATLAVGRSTVAALALREAIESSQEVDGGWDHDDEALPLGGLDDCDEDGVTRPFAEEAVRAARAAFGADPADPLVPLQLGNALTWLGDGDGAVAALREALRRDPSDGLAATCLREFGAEAPRGEARARAGVFALLLDERRASNGEWSPDRRVFGDLAAARRAAEETVSLYDSGALERDELDSFLTLLLETHRPGEPVTSMDVVAAVPPLPALGPFVVAWPGVAAWTPEEALPVGRIVRLGGSTWFPG